MEKVLFRFGSRAEYDSLSDEQIQDNSLYFILDTNELYRGNVPICTAHYYEGTIRTNESHEAAINRVLSTNAPCLNDIFILADSNGVKYPYIYAGYVSGANKTIYGWKPLYGNLSGENVVFNDGESLLDKLNSQSTPNDNGLTNIDQNTFTIYYDNNKVTGFTLKDFGTKYYVLQDRQYHPVNVDQNHPWPIGLTLQTITVNGETILGWTEPKPLELDDIKTQIRNLKEVIGQLGTPSTGLIKRIEDLENDAVKEIKIGDTVMKPVANRVTLPIFNGSNNGLVPKPAQGTPDDYVLSATGAWIQANGEIRLEWEPFNN